MLNNNSTNRKIRVEKYFAEEQPFNPPLEPEEPHGFSVTKMPSRWNRPNLIVWGILLILLLFIVLIFVSHDGLKIFLSMIIIVLMVNLYRGEIGEHNKEIKQYRDYDDARAISF